VGKGRGGRGNERGGKVRGGVGRKGRGGRETIKRKGSSRALSSRLFQGEYETVRGDDRVAEGHKSRREAPSGGGFWGRGVPLTRDAGPGVSPRENFEI